MTRENPMRRKLYFWLVDKLKKQLRRAVTQPELTDMVIRYL